MMCFTGARELIERLFKASAYVGDHKGLMLEDDQYDALAADLALSASTVQSLSHRVAALEKRYHELLFGVSKKYEGEDRHETALRYIKEHEAASVDGRRMAETENTDSVPQGTTSAVASGETPTPSPAQPGDA